MHRGLKSQNYELTKLQNGSRGYMMITLMLGFALIAIGLLAVLPEIGQQIKRDREEEMRHRGTAYMRAIQHFYKKTGRYPSRLEELENTNNIRFLRKRYKDPISRDPETGQERDFKLLHVTDINLASGPVMGQMPGMTGQGGLSAMPGVPGMNAIQGALGGMAAQMGGLQQQTGLNGASNTNLNPSANSDTDSNSNSSTNNNQPGSSSGSSSGFNGPTFGGGPILGVASTSKEKSIRVFYQKNHYKDWLFVYMPMADRGGLLTGPINPGMPTGGNLNGAGGGSMGGTMGQSSGVGQGQSSGFGQGQGQGFGQGQGLGQQGQQSGSANQNQQNSGSQPQ
jgi:type II secretory pathway pseudopilin PulG